MPAPHMYGVSDLTESLERDRPPTLLDVRTAAEFETAHIRGSHNIPLDSIGEHRDELAEYLEDDVVLVCRSGQRARQAQRRFAEAGMHAVHVLDGGIVAWEATGVDLERGRERWDLERQVRLAAGSIVLVSILLSTVVPPVKWLAAAVGAGLAVAALTNTCVMGNLLSRLPYNRIETCDPATVVAELTGAAKTA